MDKYTQIENLQKVLEFLVAREQDISRKLHENIEDEQTVERLMDDFRRNSRRKNRIREGIVLCESSYDEEVLNQVFNRLYDAEMLEIEIDKYAKSLFK